MRRVSACLLLSVLPILAQTNTGSITGTVFDQQKAVIPGVKVSATNIATNVSQSAASTAAGNYTLSSVVPGTYNVVAAAAGFSSATQQVAVETSRTVTLDITLSVGDTKTQVTVTAEAGLIQESNAAVQYNINPRQIEELPIPNSSVLRAIEMIPGVVGEVGTEQSAPTMGYTMPGTSLSVGGGRMGDTQYKADGVDNTSMYFGRISQSFSADAIQEVQIQQNSFSAEYGRVGAGVINMTTKSGTNSLHGVLMSSIQNDALNASPYTSTWRKKGVQRLWRGGGNVGGPVWIPKVFNGKNRTFFFFDYEPLRQSTNTTWYENTPTAQERNGDFSGMVYTRSTGIPITIFNQWEYNTAGTGLTNKQLVMPAGVPFPQFPGSKLPASLISPIGKKLIDLYPAPNYVNPDPTATTNYGAPMSVNNVDNRWMFKVDESVSSANRMSFRFSITPTYGKRFYFGGKDSLVDMNSWDISIGSGIAFTDTHSFGNKVNEFRLGYNRSKNTRQPNEIQNSKNWYASFGLPSFLSLGMPKFNFTSAASGVESAANINIDNIYQVNDIFNWVHGRHTIKLGVEIQLPQQNVVNLANMQGNWSFASSYTNIGTADTSVYLGLPTGSTTGRGAASLLLGFPTGISIAPTAIPYQYRWKYFAAFVQDDIKLTPRLTVNLGLRYQVEVPRSEKHHNQGTYVDGPAVNSQGQAVQGYVQLAGLGGAPSTLFPARYNNIEPRVGFAYRLQGMKWLKVMRGGYGISHTPTSGQFRSPYPDLSPQSSSLATTGAANGGQVQIDWAPLVLPKTCLQCAWPSSGKFADLSSINSVSFLNPNVSIPYMQQWNFGFGMEFGKNYGVEILYVGSKGSKLFGASKRYNTIDQATYATAFTAGLNMSDRFPNPLGLKDASGNIITVTRSALMRPNPMLGAFQDPLNQGYNSSYNSLQAQFVRRFAQGVQFNINYTLSKSIDTSSCAGQFCNDGLGNYTSPQPQLYGGNRKLEKSASIWDKTHVIRFSFNADLPFGKGKALLNGVPGWLNQIVGGWKLSGTGSEQSGLPLQAALGTSAGFPDDVGAVRPNWAPGVTSCIPNPGWRQWANIPSHQYADYLQPTLMFAPPSRFTLGNVPRTLSACRAPWTVSTNAALLKDFRLNEKVRLQFRVEAYSVFNHVNFIPNVNSGTVFTGLNYTNYVNPPWTQVQNIRTQWSDMTQNIGPQRTMQLGLKLLF
ncbi:MAG: carboxypeptidase regulatory-like domain-containing protein [Candidatus Solibacter sp.]|nr:carboxypeptidase regulatory-like domain-containing protein [Candidatus Solibacter sp.]